MRTKVYNPTGRGRKGYWQPYMADLTYKLCLLGKTNAELGYFLGVSEGVIEKWYQNNPEFQDACKRGRVIADMEISHSLYELGKGYSHPQDIIISNRVIEYDEKGKPARSYVEPLVVKTTKHYPPDYAACVKWLSTRQKAIWNDTQNVNISLNQQINITQIAEELADPRKFTTEEIRLALHCGILDTVQKIQGNKSLEN
jgi:hypothetical protein